jgi:hypothetical protein
MTDTTSAAPAAAEKPAREGVAKHELIAAAGGEHVTIDTAIGIRYTDRSTNQKFEYLIPNAVAGSPLTMLALFGAKTKATNETSRVRNGKNGGVSNPVEEMEALDEVFESISAGVWREKAEGGGGSRTDKSLLATVLIELLGSNAKGNVDHYIQRFTDDVNYMRKVLKSDAGEEYRKRAGKSGPAVESLA